jgi:hypothetical protein
LLLARNWHGEVLSYCEHLVVIFFFVFMVKISHLSSLKQKRIVIKSCYFFQLASQVGNGDLWTLFFFSDRLLPFVGPLRFFMDRLLPRLLVTSVVYLLRRVA